MLILDQSMGDGWQLLTGHINDPVIRQLTLANVLRLITDIKHHWNFTALPVFSSL